MLISIIFIIIGLALLVIGADYLVKGSSSLSKKLGIPSLVIGLTIVAFGTSAPELIVNLIAAYNGTVDIAVGNVVGSNIANILIIGGLAALFVNLKVQRSTTWKEIPFALLAVVAVLILGSDIVLDGAGANILSRSDGLILIGFFCVFLAYIVQLTIGKKNDAAAEEIPTYSHMLSIGMTIGGLVGLFYGGKILVEQAVYLATLAGMSQMLIGLTIVAIGTSLPELATTIMAARKGQADIAIGNIVGSNIFNVFWILGLTATISPLPLSQAVIFDVFVSIIATLVLFFALFIGKKHELERWQGILFIIAYIAYITFIFYRG